ncbi:hypothetical protein PV350_04315 [Streptomyces sp. PA03-6a]|nr:hypothetical protein [Streptomyces sp. PA03-6a]
MIGHLPHAPVPWQLRPPSGCTPFSLAPAAEEERPVKRAQNDNWAANLRGPKAFHARGGHLNVPR